MTVVRSMTAFDHVWRWRTMADPYRPPPGHKLADGRVFRVAHPYADRVGQACRVVARGALNSVLVEFDDGLRTVCSRYAVRRAPLEVSPRT